MGPWNDRHRQVRRSIVVGKLRRVRDARGKVATAPPFIEIPIDSRVEGLPLERLPLRAEVNVFIGFVYGELTSYENL